MFKIYENRDIIDQMVGMFQKEVAERICSSTGTKKYGILSVLIQAFYNVDYLFTVNEDAFNPPPKVKSGVIRIERNDVIKLDCDEKLFFRVVKSAFQQRRKTLRNSLKIYNLSDNLKANTIFDKRPEQLSVQAFIDLTAAIETDQ
jgi:16S rRNA (adenine1518-N6/adenine1519-N6)-dimethyltransferase